MAVLHTVFRGDQEARGRDEFAPLLNKHSAASRPTRTSSASAGPPEDSAGASPAASLRSTSPDGFAPTLPLSPPWPSPPWPSLGRVLFERAAVPLATSATKGAWLAGRRLMAIDATGFDVADTEANLARFGRTRTG
jgi:hypothetical protein